MAAEGHSDIMVSDVEVHVKQMCIIEFFHAGKMAPNDIHRCLLNIFYGDQTEEKSTVRQFVVNFSSSNNDIKTNHVLDGHEDIDKCSMQALVNS